MGIWLPSPGSSCVQYSQNVSDLEHFACFLPTKLDLPMFLQKRVELKKYFLVLNIAEIHTYNDIVICFRYIVLRNWISEFFKFVCSSGGRVH